MNTPKDELKALNSACDLMGELLAGGYRATGRPFYCHMIGVASLTAMESRDIKLISAAILHSIYELGRFPCWPLPPTLSSRRQMVTARVGADIEKLVYSFYSADWRQKLDPHNLPDIPDPEKDLLLLKIADILEDLLEDNSPIATGKIVFWPLHKLDDPIDHLIQVSNGIGAKKLASLFARFGRLKPAKIIKKSTEKSYFHTPLNSVLPYAFKTQLKRLRRR